MDKTIIRAVLAATTMLVGLSNTVPAAAAPPPPTPPMLDAPVPPLGIGADAAQRILERANPGNSPVTGAAIVPGSIGGHVPVSLEALMAARPGVNPKADLPAARAEELYAAAVGFGAAGGLAARGFAINQVLRRTEAQLDTTYDFRALVVPVGRGQTLIRPPVVSEAQLAFALGEGGQSARETGRIYRITREAQLASEPPNWRTYLVQAWPDPVPPPDGQRPQTDQEVDYWKKWVADGWAKGEAQGTDIFLSQLGKLESDLVGMARFRVLLRAGLVERPQVVFARRAVQGGHDLMRVGDTTIDIRRQPGLNPNRRRWQRPEGLSFGLIGAVPVR